MAARQSIRLILRPYMQLLRDDLSAFDGETVLTIGKFDGIHIAHQELIDHLKERSAALGVKSGMVTFDPHPAVILNPSNVPSLLTPLRQKVKLLEESGLDLLVLLTFSRETMQTRAGDYLDYLNRGLRPRELWVGEDFAMGYRREGNIAFIRAWAAAREIAVHAIPMVERDGIPVSGSRIRALLEVGAVEEAARLLGRLPTVEGVVFQGDQRGRTIGVPTANVLPDPSQAIPGNGVYVTENKLQSGDLVPGITNVGVRPTFDGQRRQVESHLFDWSGDLYGQQLQVRFLHRLRDEKRFSGLDELLKQIRADAEEARAWLSGRGTRSS